MSSSFPEMTTDRLLLRKIEDADITYIHKGLSHPEVIRFYEVSFMTLEATKEQMDWFRSLLQDGTGIWWAICSPDRKTFYGAGGLNNLVEKHARAEVGFWLLPEYWGKGFMKEAMNLILDYAFDVRGLRRIEGYVEHDNVNCKKALNKIGFQFEGTMRDCEIKNGAFINVDIFSALSTDRKS